MRKYRNMTKEKITSYLDGYYLMIIDDLIGRWGNNRSEVVRKIIERWIDDNAEFIKALIREKKEALERGYVK